jgi:glyoxylase-like metal-dependent hydrolase (beta-lactamase superfamily II)
VLYAGPHRRFLQLLTRDRVFTGNTLLIRGTGRTDFEQRAGCTVAVPAKLLRLPEDTLVFPAHFKGRHRRPSARRSAATRACR